MVWVFAIGLLAAALSSVWDGVYTADQAKRGRTAYEANCLACHGVELTGGRARSLVSDTFWRSWGEDSLASLDSVVRETMPRTAPGTLDESTYTDIVAYLLERNGYPAGTRELTRELVAGIRVTGKDGPMPVPNFSLVRVVGCLREPTAGKWVLERATDPVRTRTPRPSEGREKDEAEASVLGNGVYGLMDTYAATDGHRGEKVEVKGLLMRGSPDRLNFSSLQSLAAGCE